jgi:predicted enzyme related to lactoylglutathione lyase
MTQPAASSSATAYAPGTPIWVDLGSPDVAASARFYEQLFGWRYEDMGEEAGHYHMFFQDGAMVAAAGPLQSPQQPPAWTTYILTDNAEAVAKKVTDNGGQVLMAPFAVMDQGTMGIFMDPAGGAFAVWQADKMPGAGLFNTPVSLGWNELHSRNLDAAKTFYPAVFGWGVHVNEMEGMGPYIEWQVNGRTVGGGQGMDMEPEGIPSYWLVYFTVANADDIVKRAQELGGKVLAPAMDIPQGRIAILTDPQGATFGLFQNPPQ